MSSPGVVNLSITRENAKIYIARVIGGAKNPDSIAMAEEALLRAFNEWQNEKDWEFLLRDNLNTFTVDSCVTTNLSASISAPSTGAFDGINIGITVTGTGIPADTTISSYTRNSNGDIATITLSSVAVASGTVTLTFGGTIPVIVGVQDYNLPTDFYRHYGLRFTSNLKWPLKFCRPRDWNLITLDQTQQGSPGLFTIYNDRSISKQNKGTYRLRIYPFPSAVDVLRLEYYRKFDLLADPLDMDGTLLYKFLDYCRFLLIGTKRGFDDPSMLMKNVEDGLNKAKAKDEDIGEEYEVRMKSQMESSQVMPLWTNGNFYPSISDYGW